MVQTKLQVKGGGDAAVDSSDVPLGLPGFSFDDLHSPERLAALYERFCEDVRTDAPAFWSEWNAYRQAPDRQPTPAELSRLFVTMAHHVSRFVAHLFRVEIEDGAIAARTRALDDLFRFKVEFVRRRVLPLLQRDAPVSAPLPEDDAVVMALLPAQPEDLELAIAQAGCALMDAEQGGKRVADRIETLKRWCAARIRHPAFGGWVVFRFAETLDYAHLVEVHRPDPQRPEAMRVRTAGCARATASSSPTRGWTRAKC